MAEEFKIYTKGGDKGTTSLMGGSRVPKYDDRIEAYGTLDELNSFLGLIRDFGIQEKYRELILEVQHIVFAAESHLASENEKSAARLPELEESMIDKLEREIDSMNAELPPLKNFLLPGGHPVVSYCHISRTICRRAERLVIKVAEKFEIDPIILRFLNRLSDYLFVLARKLGQEFGADETPWKPYQ